jgi:23S rRNA-intervening sequence protein
MDRRPGVMRRNPPGEPLQSRVVAERPDYKNHPLWNEAISLTHAAYDLAERVRPSDPTTARHLRRAAVAIPAHVAGALTADDTARRDHVLTARGALAEISRQAGRAEASADPAAAAELARRAGELDRAVSFELGVAPGGVS